MLYDDPVDYLAHALYLLLEDFGFVINQQDKDYLLDLMETFKFQENWKSLSQALWRAIDSGEVSGEDVAEALNFLQMITRGNFPYALHVLQHLELEGLGVETKEVLG